MVRLLVLAYFLSQLPFSWVSWVLPFNSAQHPQTDHLLAPKLLSSFSRIFLAYSNSLWCQGNKSPAHPPALLLNLPPRSVLKVPNRTHGNNTGVLITATLNTMSDITGFSVYSLSFQYLLSREVMPIKIRSHFTCCRRKEKMKTLFNGPHHEFLQEVLAIKLSIKHKTAVNMIFIIWNESHHPFTKNTQFI